MKASGFPGIGGFTDTLRTGPGEHGSQGGQRQRLRRQDDLTGIAAELLHRDEAVQLPQESSEARLASLVAGARIQKQGARLGDLLRQGLYRLVILALQQGPHLREPPCMTLTCWLHRVDEPRRGERDHGALLVVARGRPHALEAEIHVRDDDALVARLQVAGVLGEAAQISDVALVHEDGAATRGLLPREDGHVRPEHRPPIALSLLLRLGMKLRDGVERCVARHHQEVALLQGIGHELAVCLSFTVEEVEADEDAHGPGEPFERDGAPRLTWPQLLLEFSEGELGLEPEQAPSVEHRADGLAECRGLSTEPLVDTGLPRGPGDGVGPRHDDQVPTSASHLLEHLPGQAVLREDNEPDTPLLALAEDRLDLEHELLAVDAGDALA